MAKTVRRPQHVLPSFLGMTTPTMIKEGNNSFKCSLCKKAGEYASLVPHIQTHSRNVLTYKGVQIYRCGLDCCSQPHFHCCFCNKSVILKICFIRHLKRCEEDCMDNTMLKQMCSGYQNTVRTTVPSHPTANAPAKGIVVQTPCGPALLQTVASPVEIQGTADAPLVLHATHLPLENSTTDSPLPLQATTRTTTTSASSPMQASTAKTSVEETATPTTESSNDETHSPLSSPLSPPQTPATASMEQDMLIANKDEPMSPSQDVTLLISLQPPLRDTSGFETLAPAAAADQTPTAATIDGQGQAPRPTSPVHPPHSAPPGSSVTPVSLPEAFSLSKHRIKCPHCPTVLFKRNLKVHIFRHHKDVAPNTTLQQRHHHQHKLQPNQLPQHKQRLLSVCVDAKNGIVAVQRHARGVLAPVHVRKKVRVGQVVRCDLRECFQFQQMAVRHGLIVGSCLHTRSLGQCKETAAEEVLRSEVLDEMVAHKHLSISKQALCLRRQKIAQTAGAPFSVLVNFGGSRRHLFVSVHEPKTNDFCFGRLMVSFSVDRNMWHCPCTTTHMSCLHKNIAKWHIFQTHRDMIEPSESSSSSSSSSKDASRTRRGKDTQNNAKSALGDVKRSVDYIYTQKKIPAEIPEDWTNPMSTFPENLFPTETACEVCPGCPGLGESECVTDQAKIVTMLGVVDGVCTYLRRCPECQLIYRYQEWQDGLHNFDNHLILSTELCLYLRHSLQNQIPLPKAIKMLESLRGVQFPPAEELLNAYSHFEALVSLDDDADSLATESSGCSPAVVTEMHRKAFLTLHWK